MPMCHGSTSSGEHSASRTRHFPYISFTGTLLAHIFQFPPTSSAKLSTQVKWITTGWAKTVSDLALSYPHGIRDLAMNEDDQTPEDQYDQSNNDVITDHTGEERCT